jgi:rhodanese-related sulfurtransferase
VDVRSAAEVEALPLADCDDVINIPLDELRDRLDELDPSKPTIVACRSGLRSYVGTRVLKQHGFAEVYNLSGATAMREFALNRRLPASRVTTPTGVPAPDAIMID